MRAIPPFPNRELGAEWGHLTTLRAELLPSSPCHTHASPEPHRNPACVLLNLDKSTVSSRSNSQWITWGEGASHPGFLALNAERTPLSLTANEGCHFYRLARHPAGSGVMLGPHNGVRFNIFTKYFPMTLDPTSSYTFAHCHALLNSETGRFRSQRLTELWAGLGVVCYCSSLWQNYEADKVERGLDPGTADTFHCEVSKVCTTHTLCVNTAP